MSGTKHIPYLIYETLPYLYVGVGVLVVVMLPNMLGIFSGMLMLSTGIWIWWARRTYRSAWHHPEASLARNAADLTLSRDTGLVRLVWSADYESGHVTIDMQHRKLFEISNTLLNTILDEKPKLDVELLLEDLLKDMSIHFSSEERLLAETNHPHAREHQETHRELLARCKEMADRYRRDELKGGALFKFVAHDVLSEHILTEDFKFPRQ